MKQANVYVGNLLAGILTEDDMGYEFKYDSNYLKLEHADTVSITLPLSAKPYRDKVLSPFFEEKRNRYLFQGEVNSDLALMTGLLAGQRQRPM